MVLIPSEVEAETATLRGHALRHALTVACANYGGPSGGLAAAGRSAIWSAAGTELVRLPPAGAGVAVAAASEAGWRTAIRLP
jgi:predicted amidohydrolase